MGYNGKLGLGSVRRNGTAYGGAVNIHAEVLDENHEPNMPDSFLPLSDPVPGTSAHGLLGAPNIVRNIQIHHFKGKENVAEMLDS